VVLLRDASQLSPESAGARSHQGLGKEVRPFKGINGDCRQAVACRNIAIGKAIVAIGMFVKQPRKDVLEFVRRQTGNTRKATANKAKAFLRKYE
jgi:hypothetical protein